MALRRRRRKTRPAFGNWDHVAWLKEIMDSAVFTWYLDQEFREYYDYRTDDYMDSFV